LAFCGLGVCWALSEGTGATTDGEIGAAPEPERPLPGDDGATGVYGACGTVFGLDGLKVGAGCGIGVVGAGCARTAPVAKAAIIAASETPAKSAAAARSNRVAFISVSLGSACRPHALPRQQQIRELSDPDNPRIDSRARRTLPDTSCAPLVRAPTPSISAERKTGMAGISPAMTIRWMCGYRFTHDPRIAPDSVNEI
jgi:hypothetical protein